MISASALHRVAVCPASAVLPQARTVNEYNSRGSAIHAFLADVPRLGAEEALARVPDEHRPACASIDVARLPTCEPGAYAVEVAFAYDLVTGAARELGRGTNRDYSELREGEIPGTCDVVGITPTSVIVFDYKSGFVDVAPPAQNHQMRAYALMAARTYDRPAAHLVIVRIKDDGAVWSDQATLDDIDLDVAASEIADVVDSVERVQARVDAGETPHVTMGSHCRFCPALPYCPGTTALVRQLGADPHDAELDLVNALTPETAAQTWHRLKLAKVALERVDAACRMFAEQHPVDLGDGMVLGPVSRETEHVDGGTVHHVIRRRYGDEVADQAVAFESSKAAINRAMRTVAQNTGERISHLDRAVLEEVRQLGGARKTQSRSVREHKAALAEASTT